MSRSLMILALSGVMALASLRAFRIASTVAADKEDPDAWRKGLVAVAVLTHVILLTNALAFISWVEIAASEMPERGSLLKQQLSLILGTAGLMALTSAAVGDPTVRAASNLSEAAGAAMTAAVRRLLVRFWWAALGLGVVFGVAARSVALFLALELSLVWIVGLIVRGRASSGSRDAGGLGDPEPEREEWG